jgi:hypothetical protein
MHFAIGPPRLRGYSPAEGDVGFVVTAPFCNGRFVLDGLRATTASDGTSSLAHHDVPVVSNQPIRHGISGQTGIDFVYIQQVEDNF